MSSNVEPGHHTLSPDSPVAWRDPESVRAEERLELGDVGAEDVGAAGLLRRFLELNALSDPSRARAAAKPTAHCQQAGRCRVTEGRPVVATAAIRDQPLAPPVKFHDARWSVGTR